MVSRRRLLARVGAAATAVGPGCLDGGASTGTPTPTKTAGPTTADDATTLAVTPASFPDVDASESVAVVSEPLGELLGTVAASDGPATLVHTLAEWESRPPALAALDAANLRFDGDGPSDGWYSLSLRWGPVYDYGFEVEAAAESEVPADETAVAVGEQPARVREPLVDAIRSGTTSLSPRSEAYFVLVSTDEDGTNETGTVAYLRYDDAYYAVVRRASTPVPTDELYLRLRASRPGPTEEGFATLSVSEVSDAVRGAFERALRAWSAGDDGSVPDTARDALALFDARYDYVLTAAALFRFELSREPGS